MMHTKVLNTTTKVPKIFNKPEPVLKLIVVLLTSCVVVFFGVHFDGDCLDN